MTTIHLTNGTLILIGCGWIVGAFLSGFVGAFGRDAGDWVRRRHRTITMEYLSDGRAIVSIPERTTDEEMKVIAAAIQHSHERLIREGLLTEEEVD